MPTRMFIINIYLQTTGQKCRLMIPSYGVFVCIEYE